MGKTGHYYFSPDYYLKNGSVRIATLICAWRLLLLLCHREGKKLPKNHMVTPAFPYTPDLHLDGCSFFLWEKKVEEASACLLPFLWLQVEPMGRAENFRNSCWVGTKIKIPFNYQRLFFSVSNVFRQWNVECDTGSGEWPHKGSVSHGDTICEKDTWSWRHRISQISAGGYLAPPAHFPNTSGLLPVSPPPPFSQMGFCPIASHKQKEWPDFLF